MTCLDLGNMQILGGSGTVREDVIAVLNDVSYLLVNCHSQLSTGPNVAASQRLTPFTLYSTRHGDEITGSQLEDFRRNILEQDPSFQPEFLGHIVFYGSEDSGVELQPSAVSLLNSWNTAEWRFVQSRDGCVFSPGPYIARHGRVWQPWRIYSDDNLTMTMSFKPQATGNSHDFSLAELDNTFTANSLRAVVPPKSYSRSVHVPERPLRGVTILVKDIFDIVGTKTTLCNRAWTEYHPISTKTAPCIKRLQGLGAWIVGKTRLNAMVIREETMECVEFLAPYNPRGDGYQTSSGSSSGSCAGLGAYPWVDFAIGSDTNGSCRKPAYWNGCFAVRPTHGVLDTSGVASFCPFYDVPTFFGRDVSLLREFATLWYGDSERLVKKPTLSSVGTRILYPTDYLPTQNVGQTRLIDSFVEDLESLLGIKRTETSLADMWRESKPDLVEETDLAEYLKTAGTLPYYKDAIQIVKDFVDGYKQKFDKAPFIHRALRWRWEIADKVSSEERNEGWERIYTYKKWLLDNVFREGTVLVLPVDEGKPNYRDDPPPPFGLLSGFSPLYVSPIAGTPEITAPIGEISYHSEISQRDEPLPISVSLASAPGTDLALIDLMHKTLEHGKKPVKVQTGRSIFGV